MRTEYDRSGGRELFGVVIILIGFGLLMNSMGILPYGPLIAQFWLPAMFIGIGLWQLSRSRGSGNPGGIFFLLFGVLFLLSRLTYWNFSMGKLIGPAILMWIGVSMLMRRSRPQSFRVPGETWPQPPRPPRPPGAMFGMDQTTADSSDYMHATAILGGFNRKCSSQQFRGGDFTAIMGGGKIDLREAAMEADEAVVELFAVMGGMEIQIPMEWVVVQGFTPILGGFDDKTRKIPGKSKRLVLHGTAIMGGVSVTN